MLLSWQSKNNVCTHVLEDHHELIFMSSWKEMEHREVSITAGRGG